MTLGNLIGTEWVKDDDTIVIYDGGRRISGQWFEDDLLEKLRRKIDNLSYVEGKWNVILSDEEERVDA